MVWRSSSSGRWWKRGSDRRAKGGTRYACGVEAAVRVSPPEAAEEQMSDAVIFVDEAYGDFSGVTLIGDELPLGRVIHLADDK